MTRSNALGFGLLVVIAIALMGADGDTGDLKKACEGSSNMGPELCECIEKKARAELSPGAYEFLVASLAKDDAKTAELRGKLPMTDLAAGGMFMAGAPGRCARERGQ